MLVLSGHEGRVRGVAYAPDGSSLASCGNDRSVRAWDLATGRQRPFPSNHAAPVLGVVFGPGGRALASTDRGWLTQFWDPSIGLVRPDRVLGLWGVPPDVGRQWYAAMLGGRDPAAAPEAERRAATAAGWRLCPTRARRLAPADARRWKDGRFWNPPYHSLGIPPVDRLAFRENEARLFEMSDGRRTSSVLVPAAADGTPRGTFIPGCGFSLVEASGPEVALAPDGRTLAVTNLSLVHLWDIERERLTTLGGYSTGIKALAFAPDGQTLATGSDDGAVRLWDVATGDERTCLNGKIGMINAVAFAPDGMTLAAGGEGDIVVWDVGGGV